METNETKRGRGRPRLTEEEKEKRALMRKTGELAKQPYNRPELAKYGQEYVEPGDNSRYLAHALATMNLPKIDTSDPVQVQERIDWYFYHCLENDMKPTVKGFCNALGIVRQTLLNWRTGAYRAGTHEEMIVKAYNVFEEMWENYMQNGKINPMAGVFLGVNNFGYRDVKQVNLTPVVNNNEETIDIAAIEAKYAELPED
jgi:hypothetical protein